MKKMGFIGLGIMGAPMAARSSGASALTEPTVPTGIKIGVGIVP